MKAKLFTFLALALLAAGAQAKKFPQIKFERTVIDLGRFTMDDPVQKCVFKFTNTGKSKLVITAVHASCGCTVPEYPKDPIAPGASGEIKVTYNGANQLPGMLKKSIQVYSNSKEELSRIFIKGEMTDVPPVPAETK